MQANQASCVGLVYPRMNYFGQHFVKTGKLRQKADVNGKQLEDRINHREKWIHSCSEMF